MYVLPDLTRKASHFSPHVFLLYDYSSKQSLFRNTAITDGSTFFFKAQT